MTQRNRRARSLMLLADLNRDRLLHFGVLFLSLCIGGMLGPAGD